MITDIKMPKRDGLWLIEEIRKDNQDIKILVLTCYDEFAFARKALKLGADDYILKSEVEDEELVNVMKGIKQKIDALRRTKNIQLRAESNRNERKRSLLNDLIKSDFHLDEQMMARCSELEFTICGAKLAWVMIGLGASPEEHAPEISEMKQNAILHLILDQFHEKSLAYLYNHVRTNYLFLISAPEITGDGMRKLFELVGKAARQYFDLPLQIIYTDPFGDPGEMPERYNDFIEKTELLFYPGPRDGFLKNTQEISFKDDNVFLLKERYSPALIEGIGQGDPAALQELNFELENYFKANMINPMTVKVFYSTLAGDVFTSYGQFFAQNDDFPKYEEYHYRLVNAERLAKVSEIFLAFAVKVMDELKQAREGELIVNKAINYIENNYARQISLDDIAAELNVSKYYLCNLFKEKTGETTSAYINKLRIEKVKKLLLKGDCGIKEIFEEVGFANQYYLSKVFKKITGMTISEYKQRSNSAAEKNSAS